MARLENIATLDHPPTIGESYRAPVALTLFPEKYRSLHPLLGHEHWWPYRGKPHTDPDFSAYDLHVHIEARLLTIDEMTALWLAYEKREKDNDRQWPSKESAPYMIPINIQLISGYSVHERVCLRQDTPLLDGSTDAATSNLLAGDLGRRHWHLGKRKICPHQGYDLRTTVPDKAGCITCPLHQLKYDAEGNLVITEHARKMSYLKRGMKIIGELGK